MLKLKVGAAIAAAVGLVLVGGISADAAPTASTTATACPAGAICYPLLKNSVTGYQVVDRSLTGTDVADGSLTGYDVKDGSLTGVDVADGSINSNDMSQALYNLLLAVPNNGVTSGKVADGTLTEADLAAALQAKINGPAYLKNWGEIFRNTIGNARAELGQSSSGEGLNFNVPTGNDAVMWGNEADYAGKPFTLTAVKYEVFQTGENNAIAGNMPSIKFEISNPATGATYTTLVYSPDNSAANTWTSIDAKADTGNHWGFTGTYFNTGTDRCGLNGARCTLTEALSKLGDQAKFISAGVGKGRDNAWHGAIRSLTINGDTFKFTAGGVLAQ